MQHNTPAHAFICKSQSAPVRQRQDSLLAPVIKQFVFVTILMTAWVQYQRRNSDQLPIDRIASRVRGRSHVQHILGWVHKWRAGRLGKDRERRMCSSRKGTGTTEQPIRGCRETGADVPNNCQSMNKQVQLRLFFPHQLLVPADDK